MITQTKSTQEDLTPENALFILTEGNQRFTENSRLNRNLLEQVKKTTEGQYPFAVVLSCIDSRVPVETVFDLGIGDVFSIRIAGNFVNTDILGSMEFACKAAGAKLIVVMGHTSCGAVKGACDHVELGNLTSMLSNIEPVVNQVVETGDRSSKNAGFVQNVADRNVEVTLENIMAQSEVLKTMLSNKEIGMVGAMYSVETGKVEFGNLIGG